MSLDEEAGQEQRHLLRWLAPLGALALLALALVVLRHQLHHVRYHDVALAVRSLPRGRIWSSLLLTMLAYAILPAYDAVALHYAGKPLPLRRVGLGSVIAYGVSQTLGFQLVTGGSVRYRFWSMWGLSTTDIARALSFAGASFTVGVVAVTGLALVLEPGTAETLLRVPRGLATGVGMLGLTLVAAYLVWSVVRRGTPVRVRDWEFPVPPPHLALLQLAIAVADWSAAAAVLYVLLPPHPGLGFAVFLAGFLVSQVAGLVSHVPGGVGVFETLMVLLLSPVLPPADVLAALLVYRAIYYLLPFAVALALLGGYEVRRHRHHVARAASAASGMFARWMPLVVPQALSITTFIGGALLLFSGATPSAHHRVTVLEGVLPLGVIELSHFLGSLAGAGLIVLAWAIRRRIDAAYGLTITLLAVGIAASLLKGLDWEEAVALAVLLAAVLPSRAAFYRRAALTSEPLTPGWMVAVVSVLVISVWLGLFSYKHVEYSSELWWQFSTHGDAPRFLRASVGSVALLLVFFIARLLRPAPAEPEPPTDADLERAARIAARAPTASAQLALLGDKSLLFSADDDGFLMYGIQGRSWVALGDPVGSPRTRAELAWRFREEADRHDAWAVFYEVGLDALPLYIDLGLTLLKLGEAAHVPLRGFSLDGGARKGLRRALKEVERTGAATEIVPVEGVRALLPEMRRVSDDWLAAKATREKGFSLGRFDPAYLARFPAAIVRDAGGRVVAFANLLPTEGKQEVSVDLMRYSSDAPRGVMEYLFITLLLWARDQGFARFDLGMAPLSGFEGRQLAPAWTKAGALLYRHGEHFYNFQGLRLYKGKFDPVWEPRYLASPGGLALPRVLTNVATLISGGLRGVVSK